MAISLTVLGHSCVLVRTEREEGSTASLLLDPGSLTAPLDPIEDLDAILITHAHPDHLDAEQIRRARGDREVPIYGDGASVKALEVAQLKGGVLAEPGTLNIAGVEIGVTRWTHEEIYPGVPVPPNTGYLIAGTLFAPGDAFAVPEFPIKALLLPTGAPWMKLSETIDYLRHVAPTTVIPVHDGGLAPAHREMHRNLMTKFAPEGTAVLRPSPGDSIEL